MIHSWVLGSGGMLGSAISRRLERQDVNVYRYSKPFNWTNIENLCDQFCCALGEFSNRLTSQDKWEIYWACGIGAMGSSARDLQSDTIALEKFLLLLQEKLTILDIPGFIGFASSAGALYSYCKDFEITELSTVTSQTEYALAKLAQEQILQGFSLSAPKVTILVARFLTLYGPGQSPGKNQGLLSHIARSAIGNKSIEIFVPLDTLRDYMFSDDAALAFIHSLRVLLTYNCNYRVKIIASEQSITISQIISTFSRLMQKRVRFILNRNHLSNLYPSRICYRSIYSEHNDSALSQHTLTEGIGILLSAERAAYLNRPDN